MIFFGFIIMGFVCFVVFIAFIIVCIRIKMSWKPPTPKANPEKQERKLVDIENKIEIKQSEILSKNNKFNNPESMINTGINMNNTMLIQNGNTTEEFDLKKIIMRYNQKIEESEMNRRLSQNE